MSDVRATKLLLRVALKTKRAAQDPRQLEEDSRRLTEHLTASEAWQRATSIAGFVGVNGEPHTLPLLEQALHAGKRVVLPRVSAVHDGCLDWVVVTTLQTLQRRRFGLLEPSGPGQGELPEVDLVLVPALAFSRTGARLGFGKGYYDRALEPVAGREHPLRLGLVLAAFVDPVEGAIPDEPHDVRMHALVTEEGWVRCSLVG